jgi:uncharacterized protein (DUF1778 family)
MIRDEDIRIRCTKDEKKKIEENAGRYNQDVSDFVRSRCLNVPDKEIISLALHVMSGVIDPCDLTATSIEKLGIPSEMKRKKDFNKVVKTKAIQIISDAIS